MAKVILINDGGYTGMDKVQFPVEVNAISLHSVTAEVGSNELQRIGCDMSEFQGGGSWCFLSDSYKLIDMKDYSKMSDFEINKAVAELLGLELSSDHNGDYVGIVRRSIGSRPNYIHVNYCNNPSDAWPIINIERIGVYPSEGPDFMPWIAAKNAFSVTDKNPLRAAMIVYLMMKDKEK